MNPTQPPPAFQPGDQAVHPAFGVGEVLAVEQRAAGAALARSRRWREALQSR